MLADNKGEGGILSLKALAQRALGQKTAVVFLLGVAGSALFSGDAMITPAISVLSALEGLNKSTPISALHLTRDHRHPCCAVRRPEVVARLGCGLLQPDHGAFLRRQRCARNRPYRLRLEHLAGFEPNSGRGVHPGSRDSRIRRPGQCVSGGDGRRSALCRYGSFRAKADPGGLAVHRSAGAHLQLSRPRRAHSQ